LSLRRSGDRPGGVGRCYERVSLIITTNLPFENWTEILGSELLTGAMLDRLTHRVHILEANGQSFRLKKSRRRLKQRLQAALPQRDEHSAPSSS